MSYDIEFVADELMLTVEELRGVYHIYFEDVATVLASCYKASTSKNYAQLGNLMHALKGSSNNVRFDDVALLASQMEQFAATDRGAEIGEYLPKIEEEIKIMKEEIEKNLSEFSEIAFMKALAV